MGSPAFTFRLLGRFAVLRDGEEIPPAAFAGRLSRRLLRRLLVERGTLVTKDALVESLWPERVPADPAANLEVLVSRARRALGEAALIETGAGGYAAVAGDHIDVDLETLLSEASAARRLLAGGDPQGAQAASQSALRAWSGEPLPEDTYEEWAAEPRAAAARAFLDALETGAEAALELGDAGSAVAVAERAASREPMRERSALLLVRALAASGDPAAALEGFAAFRDRYAEELGLDPSQEAMEIQRRVLRGDAIDVPDATRSATPHPATLTVAGVPAPFAFAGRDDEVAALLGGDRVVLVRGISGSGKTRLLEEVAARSSMPVIRARAFLAERLEPWSLARPLLREVLSLDAFAARALPDVSAAALLDVVPELEDVRATTALPLDPPSRRGLALEAARRLVETVATVPTLLIADDLQWADATSLQLLSTLAARVENLRLILAYRPDATGTGSSIGALLEELERSRGARTISVGPLPPEAVAGLIEDATVAHAVADHTDRMPLTVVEVLRTLEAEGLVRPDGRGRWRSSAPPNPGALEHAVRSGERRAIAGRVAALDPSTRRVLGLLCVAGRETSARTVAAAAQLRANETLDRLDDLARAGLAHAGEGGWATSHDAVAATVVSGLEPHEASRLHGMLAVALVAQDAESSEIAPHLAAAGDLAAAAPRYADAAESALGRFADSEAKAFAGSGLEGARSDPDRARLHSARGEARSRSGDLTGAREDLRAALAATQDAPSRSELLARMAMLEGGSRGYERAEGLVDMALAEAGKDPIHRAEALAVGAMVDLNLGRLDRASARADEALGLFEGAGDARGVAGILDGRAMTTFLAGRIHAAEGLFDRVAHLFLDAGELLRVGTPRSTRGHALVFLARPDEGLIDADAALNLARDLGHAEGESYALWHRAEALAALDRGDDAIAAASEALAIAERIGHREWSSSSLRALGIGRQSVGDIDGAIEAFARSREAGAAIPLFAGWALARESMCLVAAGRIEEATPLVEAALRDGTPLSAYEARWAEAELRAALADPDAPKAAADAAAFAEEGGYLAALPRLRELAQPFA